MEEIRFFVADTNQAIIGVNINGMDGDKKYTRSYPKDTSKIN